MLGQGPLRYKNEKIKRRTIGDDRHQDTAEVILDSIDLNFILIE